ncbi:MAG: ribosome biogenesis factor YjgA [Gammaproteobacteria bacterium]|nr:MAG: ribosome biogenesis factor YjgA [Gammaproteobacteria bacterium]
MTSNPEPHENSENADSVEEKLISKSQKKRDASAAQELGKDLLSLSSEALNTIELPDTLSKALDDARRIKKNSALKRQLQYIGKLMRHMDVEPIREQYLKLTNHYRKDIKEFHLLEKWRDRLLSEGDKALEDLINEMPDTDRQHLRQLIRQSAKETKLNKSPKSAREIFKYLKTLFE